VAGSDLGDRPRQRHGGERDARPPGSRRIQRQAVDRPGSALAVSPDGRRTYVGGAGSGAGSVTVLDNDRPAPELTVPVAEFSAMALSPDGRTLYLVDAGGPVRMLDAGTLRPIGQFSLGQLRLLRAGRGGEPGRPRAVPQQPPQATGVVDLVGRRSSAPCR